MPHKRCIPCGGSGKVMGGGMLMADCESCDGCGKIFYESMQEIMAKDTKEYKKAKAEIKALDNKISDKEAEDILDKELEKQKPIEINNHKKRV